MQVWRVDFRGTWHLYDHIPRNLPDKEDSLSFDIVVDCHDFYPFSYEEVKVLMKTKNWKPSFDTIKI